MWANMNETEHALFESFWRRHEKKCKPKDGLLLRVSTSSGIGVGFWAICPECKKEKNLTDYSCW